MSNFICNHLIHAMESLKLIYNQNVYIMTMFNVSCYQCNGEVHNKTINPKHLSDLMCPLQLIFQGLFLNNLTKHLYCTLCRCIAK